MLKKTLSISIMFPCYNDRETIITLIENAHKTISEYTDDFEIIVIDDGSSDNSYELLIKAKKKFDKLRIVLNAKNTGYGNVIVQGLKTANKEYFFYTDGDGQYDVKEIKRLLPLIDKDTVLVNGYKITRHDPLYRRIIGSIYNILMKIIFHIKIKDIDCDFRIIKREIFDNYKFFSTSGTICIELVKYAEKYPGNIKQCPVNHYHREYGHSQFFNIKRLIKVFCHIIILWFGDGP